MIGSSLFYFDYKNNLNLKNEQACRIRAVEYLKKEEERFNKDKRNEDWASKKLYLVEYKDNYFFEILNEEFNINEKKFKNVNYKNGECYALYSDFYINLVSYNNSIWYRLINLDKEENMHDVTIDLQCVDCEWSIKNNKDGLRDFIKKYLDLIKS